MRDRVGPGKITGRGAPSDDLARRRARLWARRRIVEAREAWALFVALGAIIMLGFLGLGLITGR